MSLIISGKTFNDGEQLTAAKLNQMFADATLSTTGVDGTTIVIDASTNVLGVRTGGINTASLAQACVVTDKLPDSTVTETDGTPDGVTLPKIQHIETNKILGRTTDSDGIVETITLNNDDAMANASITSLATDGSIKAYVTSMRPKFVSLTGGTLDLSLTNQPDDRINTYNISEFTSDDPDFETYKIVGLMVEAFVGSTGSRNIVYASLNEGQTSALENIEATISRTQASSSFDSVTDTASTQIPISAGQQTFSFRYIVGDTAYTTYNRSTIRGAIIMPGLTDPSA